MIECKFSLDLTKNGIQKTVYAKAGEQNARKLIVTLTHSGCVFVLASQEKTYSAKVFLESGETFDAEVVGNTVQAVIPNAFPEAQVRICELRISHGNEVVFTPMFELIIEESLGNKAESESLEMGVRYQESLADTQVQTEEMQDRDYVMIYDESKGVIMRLPWSVINERLGNFTKNHEELDNRNKDNQHSINAIEGLQSILENLRADIDLKASQELVNGLQTNIDSKAEQSEIVRVDMRIDRVDEKITSTNNYLQEEINRVDESLVSYADDIYQRLENLSPSGGAGITPEQAQAIEDNKKARHTHENKNVLDNLDEENGVLTYKGNTIGGSGLAKRPTSEITLEMWSEQAEQKVLLGADEIDLDPALVGKEIADVEFVSTDGNVSIKDMAEKDLIPYISMLNHFTASEVDGVPVTLFAGVYYPGERGWLYTQLTSYAINAIKITYYTD